MNSKNGKDVINKDKVQDEINLEKIKLIIWDMDETFWKGTLSEGNVVCPEEHVLLIKLLAVDGIVNSISSKNDYESVIAELEKIEKGLSQYFVYNNINWDDKGIQIIDKLKNMNLRAENTLFIDDNLRNLEEVLVTNPGIMIASPNVIPAIIEKLTEQISRNGGPRDWEKKRLEQYHLLETKFHASKKYESNEAFLYNSDIRVEIHFDCLNEIDRITELVARTNQLNYTKNRVGKDELEKQITNDWNRSAYIIVRDKFGDYGIVGFYCYSTFEKTMIHFLFSCRILGMGVEQYIYNRMGCPPITIAEPIASKLELGKNVDWILENTEMTKSEQLSEFKSNRKRILLKGPCDLSAIDQYLIGGSVTSEFNFVNNKGFVTTGQNHSVHIYEGNVLEDEIQILFNDAPFLIRQDFETMIFKKEYSVICYSLLPDCHAGLYQHKETGLYISFGSVNFDLTDENNWAGYIEGTIPNHFFPFTENILKEFREKWTFIGTTPDDVLMYNLEYMYENIPGSPIIVLLLGSEIEYEGDNAEFADHARRHARVNRMIEEFVSDKPRMKLINMTDYITSMEDYEDSINHFSRRVYYNIATKIVEYINERN